MNLKTMRDQLQISDRRGVIVSPEILSLDCHQQDVHRFQSARGSMPDDFLNGKPASLKRAVAAVPTATLNRAERDRRAVHPTDLPLVDEANRIRMSGHAVRPELLREGREVTGDPHPA